MKLLPTSPFSEGSIQNRRKTGSALVLTLLCVALMLGIVLAFVGMVRSELRNVLNHQQLMAARANSQLGLQLAVAKLQELAGPDTRVTAPFLLPGETRPNVGHTGQVLDAARFRSQGTSRILNPNYSKNLGHLISHNPSATFSPETYWPFLGGNRVAAGNVLLVGPGSVPLADENSDAVPDGYVAAPLRDIPGAGSYAYHVRDNGLKAQINLSDSFMLENGGRRDLRPQAATAQRSGSEAFLPGLDAKNPQHQLWMQRLLSPSQVDLTPFPGAEGVGALFHDITLQSLGLPVNVREGGLKKDLTAVMREAEANGGNINNGGTQWLALRDFQTQRILRMRAETLALPTSPPAGIAPHLWNALTALTLREDQAQPTGRHNSNHNAAADAPELREKVFPPLTDMNVRWDPAGPSWRQFLTTATLRQRRSASPANPSAPVIAGRVEESQHQISPVVARFSLGVYFTMDWPKIRLHFIPTIVLWNPYNVPISTPANHIWRFRWGFEPQHYNGYGFSLRMSNPNWRGGQTLWSPVMRIPYKNSDNGGSFDFRLLSPSGGTDVVIPPGEAVFFTLREHQRVPVIVTQSTSEDTNFWYNHNIRSVPPATSYQIDLVQGIHGMGGYSFYSQEDDINDWILNDVARGPRRKSPDKWSTSGTDAWNAWDSAGFPLQVIPHDPVLNLNPDIPNGYNGSRYPVRYAQNQAPVSHLDIAVNINGLDPAHGWRIEQTAIVVTGRGDDGSQIRSRGFHLAAMPTNSTSTPDREAWWQLPWAYMQVPTALHFARPDDIDNPAKPNLLPYFAGTPPSFDSNQPFDETYPIFPNWGLSWGLRMPDTSFAYQQSSTSGATYNLSANFGAPSRWLVDYNPAAPFQIQDPIGRTRDETHRAGHINPPAYLGGFTLDPDTFNLVQLSHPNTQNQYIGYSDDLPPAGSGQTGWRPRMVLYEVPKDSEDMTSIASFQHARPHSTGHAWAYLRTDKPDPDLRNWMATGNNATGPNPSSDIASSSPVYPVGNSYAHVLVPRHKAHHSYFPNPNLSLTTPTESVPFAANTIPNSGSYPTNGDGSVSYYPAYDLSYVMNDMLWDDFMLTPDSNRRLQWDNAVAPARDFHQSASKVLIAGSFNVNSTSPAAWAALLGSFLDIEVPNRDGHPEADAAKDRIPLTRFLDPLSEAFSPSSGDQFDHARAFSGYRRLTPDEVKTLSEAIVEQVKLRGPFLSLSDFVNRQLRAEANDPDGLGLSGAIQRAIDVSGLNAPMGQPADAPLWMRPADFQGQWKTLPGTNAFYGMSLNNVEGSRAAGSAGYLMQGDILSRVGAVLSARSDTFTVRAYGGVGDADQPSARAWVEAVVQRLPDYVDATNPPETAPSALSPINQLFGRRFTIISFRWLGEDEI